MAGSFARVRIEQMSLLLEGLEGVKQGVDVAIGVDRYQGHVRGQGAHDGKLWYRMLWHHVPGGAATPCAES